MIPVQAHRHKGFFHSIASALRDVDIFGRPVGLKFKNRFNSNSVCGGLLSLLLIAGICIYFAALVSINRGSVSLNVTQSLEKVNIGMDPNRTLTLTIDNFDIALGVLYGGSNSSITQATIDDYFTYNLNRIDYELFTDPAQISAYGSTYRWDKTPIPMVVCDETRFKNMSQVTSNLGITGVYYCPDPTFQLKLQGGFTTPTAQIFEVSIDYCNQAALTAKFPGKNRKCKTVAESQRIISQMQIYIPVLTQSIKGSRTELKEKHKDVSPVTNIINNDIYLTLHRSISNNYYYKISDNEVRVDMTWASNQMGPQTYHFQDMRFYHLQPGEYEPTMNLPLLTVEFLLDENINHVQVSTVYFALSEVCAFTGGLMFFVWALTRFSIGWITEQAFTRRLVQRLYAVYLGSQSGDIKKFDTERTLQNNFTPDVEDAFSFIRSLRSVSSWTLAFSWLKVRAILCCGRRPGSGREMVLDRAAYKLDRNLDIVRVMKKLRQVDVLSRIVLSDPKRHLTGATKRSVVSTHVDEEQLSDSENESFKRLSAAVDSDLKAKIQQAFKAGDD